MQKESKDKMIRGTETRNKASSSPPPNLQEFHFSGGLEYEPITIQAKDIKEAEKIWKEKRKKVAP